jgi:hypothetical protein
MLYPTLLHLLIGPERTYDTISGGAGDSEIVCDLANYFAWSRQRSTSAGSAFAQISGARSVCDSKGTKTNAKPMQNRFSLTLESARRPIDVSLRIFDQRRSLCPPATHYTHVDRFGIPYRRYFWALRD